MGVAPRKPFAVRRNDARRCVDGAIAAGRVGGENKAAAFFGPYFQIGFVEFRIEGVGARVDAVKDGPCALLSQLITQAAVGIGAGSRGDPKVIADEAPEVEIAVLKGPQLVSGTAPLPVRFRGNEFFLGAQELALIGEDARLDIGVSVYTCSGSDNRCDIGLTARRRDLFPSLRCARIAEFIVVSREAHFREKNKIAAALFDVIDDSWEVILLGCLDSHLYASDSNSCHKPILLLLHGERSTTVANRAPPSCIRL